MQCSASSFGAKITVKSNKKSKKQGRSKRIQQTRHNAKLMIEKNRTWFLVAQSVSQVPNRSMRISAAVSSHCYAGAAEPVSNPAALGVNAGRPEISKEMSWGLRNCSGVKEGGYSCSWGGEQKGRRRTTNIQDRIRRGRLRRTRSLDVSRK